MGLLLNRRMRLNILKLLEVYFDGFALAAFGANLRLIFLFLTEESVVALLHDDRLILYRSLIAVGTICGLNPFVKLENDR